MNGTEWLNSLPEKLGEKRDAMILDAVQNGIVYCNWLPVVSRVGNDCAIFQVCDDAMHADLENGRRFRPPVSATLAQKCADIIGGSLITSKVSDLAYQQADVVLPAVTLGSTIDMTTTSRSKTYNEKVDEKRQGRGGLVRDCGKAWILSNWLGRAKNQAINYGFYDPRAPYKNSKGIRMHQSHGSKHDSIQHSDYSQTLIVMAAYCSLNGEHIGVAELLKHPTLHKLISDEGIIKYSRQPGV